MKIFSSVKKLFGRPFRRKPKLGTFDKWVFPVITNMADDDILDEIVSVQPMSSPTSPSLSLFVERPMKPPIPEFWEKFIDKRGKRPSQEKCFLIAEGQYAGQEGYVHPSHITHMLRVPDPKALVEAAMYDMHYHRDDLPEDHQMFVDARKHYQEFADSIHLGYQVCHFHCGGFLSMRDGLLVLRKGPDGWEIMGFSLLKMS